VLGTSPRDILDLTLDATLDQVLAAVALDFVRREQRRSA
jgi:hypothetical protein